MTDEPTAEEMARTLRSEARKVKHYLRVHEKGFRIRTLAGFDLKEEAQVRRWLDMLARNLIMDAEELEEHGHQGNAGENPRAEGGHRRGRGR